MVTFVMSGAALRAATDASWPQDCPRGFAALQAAPIRKVGKGRQATVTMEEIDARDLADYLWSVAEVWACMTAEECGSDRPAPIYEAVRRIEEALKGIACAPGPEGS